MADLTKSVILCRVSRWGKVSLAMTVDPQLRDGLGLVERDVLGFRLIQVQGRVLAVCEKIQMGRIAVLSRLPADVLPSER
jgi:hypothetical protein